MGAHPPSSGTPLHARLLSQVFQIYLFDLMFGPSNTSCQATVCWGFLLLFTMHLKDFGILGCENFYMSHVVNYHVLSPYVRLHSNKVLKVLPEKTIGDALNNQKRKTTSGETTLFLPDLTYFWLGVSNIFYFHPYLGKIPILTNIFQRGWNQQLDLHVVWQG